MYLLDTNVISEFRKILKNKGDIHVTKWSHAYPMSSFYLSGIVLMELRIGILLKQRKDPTAGIHLQKWYDTWVLPNFDGRILTIDSQVLDICATLHVPNPRSQFDSLIASTAIRHGLAIVTRNVADFDGMSVMIINPFEPTNF